MSISDTLKQKAQKAIEPEGIDVSNDSSPIAISANTFKRKSKSNIDTAIRFEKKAEEDLYNEIVQNPTHPGIFVKDFSDGIWDLHRMERYIHDTYSVAILPSVLDYQKARLTSEDKKYIKKEVMKMK